MTLCLLFAWIVVSLALIKGIKSLGKVSQIFIIDRSRRLKKARDC